MAAFVKKQHPMATENQASARHPRGEQDYNAHQQHPDPAPEALEEKDDKPAGNTIKWAIIIAIAVLAIIFLLYYWGG